MALERPESGPVPPTHTDRPTTGSGCPFARLRAAPASPAAQAEEVKRKPLVAPEDLDGVDLPQLPAHAMAKLTAFAPASITAMREAFLWAKGFLGCPHAHLGRDGDVCPFVRGSIKRGSFWLTALEGTLTLESARAAVGDYLGLFNALPPLDGPEAIYKTILIVCPGVGDDAAPLVIDQLQQELKPGFVDEGVMIGQFHARCPEPGVRNPNFRPLQARVPMLVIRNMAPEDLVFLTESDACFRSYLRRVGAERVPARLQELFERTAARYAG